MLLLFTDLDDTLFTSARKAAPTPAHVPLAYLKDGTPISYASPCQQALLAHWQAQAVMIPVTARNLDAYRRVRIPFTAHAVINHGGIILLPDGSADPGWRRAVRMPPKASPDLKPLPRVCRRPSRSTSASSAITTFPFICS